MSLKDLRIFKDSWDACLMNGSHIQLTFNEFDGINSL